ncbi:MAG TPA: hypothetical protein VM285_00795, partial [Polyangia bacterium]|nr:hypothetical protein [Polyangia bacterium]
MVAVSALLTAVPAGAAEQLSARVAIIDIAGSPAPAEEVASELRERLAAARVEVDVHGPAEEPETSLAWAALARKLARERPGTLALFGWRCEADGSSCAVLVCEPDRGAVAEFPVARGESVEDWPGVLASALGEAVLGGLLPELQRLPASGIEPPSREQEDEDDGDASTSETPGADRLRLWIEGGYTGEYAHPDGRPIHGPFLGLSLAPGRYVAPTLGVGWLGLQRGEGAAGEVTTHRIPVSLAIRLRFEVGPATFAVAPVGRLDTVFSRRKPAGPEAASSSTDLEIHVGGATTWHLPFPRG